jgi:hypothetical protein
MMSILTLILRYRLPSNFAAFLILFVQISTAQIPDTIRRNGLYYEKFAPGLWEYKGIVPVPVFPSGSVFCDSNNPTEIVEAISLTGRVWMDRNLGASRVALSSSDSDAYGDLYQWGRRADGHQCRNAITTSTLSSSDQPGHGDFIIATSSPYDWRSPQNIDLWLGLSGVNNPCPSGFRLPTEAEFSIEHTSWPSFNAAGAFA